MGCHPNITISKFPQQSEYLGRKVSVCFHYDTNNRVEGKVIRDDIEKPFIMLIELVDSRVVLSTECQYSFQ